jgi:hypothetical protein
MHYRPSKIRCSATNPIGRHHDSVEWLPPEQWIAVAPIPAVVTQQQFELAQAKLRQNQSFARRNNKAEYLLRALVSCGLCRLACQARRTSGNKYYLCAGKNKEVRQRRGQTCASRFIPAQQLDDLIWQDLCELLADPSYIDQTLARAQGGQWLPQELQARRDGLRKAITSLTQQLNRLTEAYLGGVMPLDEYQRRRRELEQRQQALEQQAQQLGFQADHQNKLAGLMESVEDFLRRVQRGLSQATFGQKRQLLELLVDRVVDTHEEVEIRYEIPTSPKSEKIRFCQLRSDYFHNPSASLAVRMLWSALRSSAFRSDMRHVGLAAQSLSSWLIIKSCVYTNVLRLGASRTRAHDGLVVKQFGQGDVIIDVGGSHHHTQRHATPVNQHVIFHSGFGSVGGIGAVFFPPNGDAVSLLDPLPRVRLGFLLELS